MLIAVFLSSLAIFALIPEAQANSCQPRRAHLNDEQRFLSNLGYCGNNSQEEATQRSFIQKFTHYAPGQGSSSMQGSCKTVALQKYGAEFDPCVYNLENFASGARDAVTAAVPQRGGSSGMFGAVYQFDHVLVGGKPLKVRAIDHYNTQSDCLCKMDLASKNMGAVPTDNGQGEATIIGAVEKFRNGNKIPENSPDFIKQYEAVTGPVQGGTVNAVPIDTSQNYVEPGRYAGPRTILREPDAVAPVGPIEAFLRKIFSFVAGKFGGTL